MTKARGQVVVEGSGSVVVDTVATHGNRYAFRLWWLIGATRSKINQVKFATGDIELID